MMSTDREDEVGRFALSLRRARREAGDPSYRELARRTKYSISSICRTLNGTTFPRWAFTELLLKSYGISEEQIRGHWRRIWLETAEAVSPLGTGQPADTAQDDSPAAAPGEECGECGALVLNPLRHQAWHAAYKRRASGRIPPTADVGGNVHRLSG
jgi:transcriptional regulator with XRE-family HTH domain